MSSSPERQPRLNISKPIAMLWMNLGLSSPSQFLNSGRVMSEKPSFSTPRTINTLVEGITSKKARSLSFTQKSTWLKIGLVVVDQNFLASHTPNQMSWFWEQFFVQEPIFLLEQMKISKCSGEERLQNNTVQQDRSVVIPPSDLSI